MARIYNVDGFFCPECKAVFTEGEAGRLLLRKQTCWEPAEYEDVCPECGNLLGRCEEAHSCENCGELYGNDSEGAHIHFCDNCYFEFAADMEDFKAYLAKEYLARA